MGVVKAAELFHTGTEFEIRALEADIYTKADDDCLKLKA